MKTYEWLMIDVDDTLLDFKASESLALKIVFTEFGLPYIPEVASVYQTINHALWQRYEQGKVGRATVLVERFNRTFHHFDKRVDGEAMDERFRACLAEHPLMMPGVNEVIPKLAQSYQLVIVSNGVGTTQRQRLARAGLLDYFTAIFVSDDVGYQKPERAFFSSIFDQFAGKCSASNSFIIGDSLSADIQGGLLSNIATCWYNPQKVSNSTDWQPTYQLQSWDEIGQLLSLK